MMSRTKAGLQQGFIRYSASKSDETYGKKWLVETGDKSNYGCAHRRIGLACPLKTNTETRTKGELK